MACSRQRCLPSLAVQILFAVGVALLPGLVWAAQPPPANVPPTLEIEVLDPGVDPHGNPAVLLRPGQFGSELEVDIPPTILVHRYYYTGDRSFQAQILPGGPSIVVANHPKTGERCYIPVQMLPGAPRVIYTSKGIEYDYGPHGIKVVFGPLGSPTVKYRSGVPWKRRVAQAVHWPKIQETAGHVRDHASHVTTTSSQVLKETYIDTTSAMEGLTLPIKNTVRLLPLGSALLDPDRSRFRAEKIGEHERRKAIEQAQRREVGMDASLETVR
jgi:hypothetical protein